MYRPHRQQLVLRDPQVAQRTQRDGLRRVLLELPVAHLHVPNLGVALAALVLRGAWFRNARGVHHHASLQLQPFGRQQGVDDGQAQEARLTG